jgi:acyl dehydratase
MNLDVVGRPSQPSSWSWTSKDAILYALGVGAGAIEPTKFELEFTTENSFGLDQKVLPTFPVILGRSPLKEFDFGNLDFRHAVLGEQSLQLYGATPVEGTVRISSSVTGIYDKGSGCLVHIERLGEFESRPLYLSRTSIFIRGAGGFGGARGPVGDEESQLASMPIPSRIPDVSVRYMTRADQSLIYRLSGDLNPLHSDPKYARRVGFEAPILHGLCTYGFAGRALLHGLCDSDPLRFGGIRARFSRPVRPGDELVMSIWDNSENAKGSFRFITATASGDTVIEAGLFQHSHISAP